MLRNLQRASRRYRYTGSNSNNYRGRYHATNLGVRQEQQHLLLTTQSRPATSAAAYDAEEVLVAIKEETSTLIPRNQQINVNQSELKRLQQIRNVGILAHVDAGKTTVTERFLELAGIVRQAGSVDHGNTVTDYLPAERERGITIQSAAISFPWRKDINIHLIDTPGHVDFSVEVNRAVAVLDGGVLIVDAVAGVQAQTETVWRTMRSKKTQLEPLPCLVLVNKLDKVGCHFGNCIDSVRRKLPGSNPVAIQLPLFRSDGDGDSELSVSDGGDGEFVGVVDLVHMRSVLYSDADNTNGNRNGSVAYRAAPILAKLNLNEASCKLTAMALEARANLVAALADVDEEMEEFFLSEVDPSNEELMMGLRRATLSRSVLPVLAGAALRNKGMEPLLDSIADLLPSPIDRLSPAITKETWGADSKRKSKRKKNNRRKTAADNDPQNDDGAHSETSAIAPSNSNSLAENLSSPPLGHPLHDKLIAFAFKVVHMKGKGSGDGRVVFARVYSGKLKAKSVVKVFTPSPTGSPTNPRTERIASLLEIAGGRFDNLEDGFCESGEVCALVGLKTVVTGDTIVLESENTTGTSKKGKNGSQSERIGNVCLAGVASPKPVLTVRLEAASSDDEKKLSNALALLSVEDPSLDVKESESSATLVSGLGELHIEVIVDRLRREFGVDVEIGAPSVAYRETIISEIETNDGGLLNYDRTVGGSRLQAAIHLLLEPNLKKAANEGSGSLELCDNVVVLHDRVREYLNVDEDAEEDDLVESDDLVKALVEGIKGSLRRGYLGPFPITNVKCHVLEVDAERGAQGLREQPGAIRAAAAHAISSMISSENGTNCTVLEPRMRVEVTIPDHMVGNVLSDINTRRGTVGDVIIGDDVEASPDQVKATVTSDVPLVEILGYANTLRSVTGGEGTFSAEYKGHSVCEFKK